VCVCVCVCVCVYVCIRREEQKELRIKQLMVYLFCADDASS